MIDTDKDIVDEFFDDKYERTTPELEEFEGENLGDLITNLLAEVKRLREGIQNALYLFQEAGNPKMSDKKRLDTICDALLEVIE